MLELSQYCLVASIILVALSLASYLVALMSRRGVRTQSLAYAEAGAGRGGGGGAGGKHGAGAARRAGRGGAAVMDRTPSGADLDGPGVVGVTDGGTGAATATAGRTRGMAWYGSQVCRLALIFLTGSLVARAIATGHGPFANQYEFAISFAWGSLAAYVYFEWRYRIRTIALLVLPITEAMLLYAMTIDADAEPLVPALQNNLLLTLHVVTAIVGYGAAAVAFAAGALYLVQPDGGRRGLPKPALLDEIGYRAVVLAFPLLTSMIILGAIWADIAWGSYWTWDPKETASLVTWLIYGAYLHARVARGWRGRRAAWLLILGFTAVLFTYFGNLFFGGLHAYA